MIPMTRISLTDVTVRFPIHATEQRSLRRALIDASIGGRFKRSASGEVSVEAISGASLEIGRGDRVGLIGLNGAGKTTLLRVMGGLLPPTTGTVQSTGRIITLMDTFMGMISGSTGRENIRNRGYLLGMSPGEIDRNTQDIIEFSELGDFIDLPTKTYSSGMFMRLAFAISTSVDADALLIDEGIGVGDAKFMDKAGRRLKQFYARAGALVLASHSIPIIEALCTRLILLDRGAIIFDGAVDIGLNVYNRISGS